MSNPPCPKCGNPKTYLNGDTKSGCQTYRCSDKKCDARFSPNPTGRPLQGDAPVPGKERTAKWRAREKLKKQQQRSERTMSQSEQIEVFLDCFNNSETPYKILCSPSMYKSLYLENKGNTYKGVPFVRAYKLQDPFRFCYTQEEVDGLL